MWSTLDAIIVWGCVWGCVEGLGCISIAMQTRMHTGCEQNMDIQCGHTITEDILCEITMFKRLQMA